MKKIIEHLGLPADATEAQILKWIKDIQAQNGTAISDLGLLKKTFEESSLELKNLRARSLQGDSLAMELATLKTNYSEAVHELEMLRSLPRRDTATINPEALAAKLNAGLNKSQALEVLAAQAEHDATRPHDELPDDDQD